MLIIYMEVGKLVKNILAGNNKIYIAIVFFVLFFNINLNSIFAQVPTVTPITTVTATATATPTATVIATATPTATVIATATPTATVIATATPTATVIATATPTPTPTVETGVGCIDLIDNDNDGLIDCDDPDCTADPFCVGALTETGSCTDFVDNDFDGFRDCDDPDCSTDQSCSGGTGSGSFIVDFDATPKIGAAPLTVNFIDQSISTEGSIIDWRWNFGDGSKVSVIQNPSHSYRFRGFYTITLTARNSAGNFKIRSKPDFIIVTTAEQPDADFVGTPTGGDVPLAVQFTDLSTSPNGKIISWLWDFGDGGSSKIQNPLYTYNFSGLFWVTLEVNDILGKFNIERKSNYIFVENPNKPNVGFSATPEFGLAPLNVQFTDLSTSSNGAIVRWFWDFGDGKVGLLQHPSHIYLFPGFFSVGLEVEDRAGETGFANKLNFISAIRAEKPVVDFEASPLKGDVPLNVSFKDLSVSPNGDIVRWSWDFGDKESSDKQNPIHRYTSVGIFTVSLEVADTLGANEKIIKRGLIITREAGAPEPAFTATPTTGFVPLEVTFEDLSISTTGIVSWLWDFGDGETATEQNPVHTFNDPGFFSINLEVANSGGKSAFINLPDFIIADQKGVPIANFSADPLTGVSPLSVQFTDTSRSSEAEIVNWIWGFGDGNISEEQNPLHVYKFPGFFTVELEINDSNGLSSFVTKPGFVSVEEGEDVPIEGDNFEIVIRAPFDPSFSQHPNKLLVPFNPNSPAFPINVGVIDQKTGKFIDGIILDATVKDNSISTVTPESVITGTPLSGGVPQARFIIIPASGGGNTNLTIVAKKSAGGDVIISRSLIVDVFCLNLFGRAIPCSGDGTTPEPDDTGIVESEFSGDPLVGFGPLTVQFFDQSTGNINNHSWVFGDGDTSTEQNPEHTYNKPGIYTVELTVSGTKSSDVESKTNLINVLDDGELAAEFSANPTVGFPPLTVQFSDLSVGEIASWTWTFGNGAISPDQNPLITYKEAGIFTVSLIVNGTNGSDSESKTNLIVALEVGAPQANFSASPTSGKVPLFVQFTDTSEGDITAWSWDFGDGKTSTKQNPTHTFKSEGFYTVILTASGPKGTNTETKTNLIIAEGLGTPVAAFSASPTTGETPLNVDFVDLSEPAGLIDSWLWDFGDSGTSNDQNPPHKYNRAGIFTVSLTVSNEGGADSAVKSNFINVEAPPTPVADFFATPTVGIVSDERPFEVQFTDTSEPVDRIDNWFWDFGDGGRSLRQQNPLHIYLNEGIYTVSLTISNEAGTDSEVKTNLIEAKLPPRPEAEFIGEPTVGFTPLLVEFSDFSQPSGLIDSWLWEFGDGSSSTEQNPTHTYERPGDMKVSLTVTNRAGVSTEKKNRFINVKSKKARTLLLLLKVLIDEEKVQAKLEDIKKEAEKIKKEEEKQKAKEEKNKKT